MFKSSTILPQSQAVTAALLTPIFLGCAPIFGKIAISLGADPFSVAAIRTTIAAGLLWLIFALFFRRYLYIYPAGLLGCVIVGSINGVGSLFYYGGLNFLEASQAQLLNGMYLILALLLARIGGERLGRRMIARVLLAVGGIILITGFSAAPINWLGVGLMLASALMFAGTVILSQYVLYEMPAQTATLYIVTTMAVVVLVVWTAVGNPLPPGVLEVTFAPILALGITTALSRLTMFTSIQAFGSVRTAVIAALEIIVALALAFVVLGERLTVPQMIGVGLLLSSLLLVRATDLKPRHLNLNSLFVRDIASLQYQRIAFHRAFGRPEHDNAAGVMGAITTQEMRAIQRMMGAKDTVDPFPILRPVEESAGGNVYLSADELAAFLERDDPAPADDGG